MKLIDKNLKHVRDQGQLKSYWRDLLHILHHAEAKLVAYETFCNGPFFRK